MTFNPSKLGARTAALSVGYTGVWSAVTVALTGKGCNPGYPPRGRSNRVSSPVEPKKTVLP
jgi:hypothetical protein